MILNRGREEKGLLELSSANCVYDNKTWAHLHSLFPFIYHWGSRSIQGVGTFVGMLMLNNLVSPLKENAY